MTVIRLESIDDPRLDIYRDIKLTNLTRWSGLFIAEGKRVVKRLLESDFAVESVLLSARRLDEFRPWLREELTVYVLPESDAEQLIGYNFHSGALACGLRRDIDLRSLLEPCRPGGTLVVLPNVNDPENVGSIIRLAAAFGAAGVLVGKACADPFSRRALRVSMATALSVPVLRCEDLESVLVELRDTWGFELAATVLDDRATPLEQAERQQHLALLLGNEGHGLGEPWTSLCSTRLTIAMERGTDSLNVSMAAAVVLHYMMRMAPRGDGSCERGECEDAGRRAPR